MIWNERKFETGWGMMMIYRYGSRTGFLVILVPSESAKDVRITGVSDPIGGGGE